ncbi:choice-of-anchor J domain-containing protein [Myroides guanonis]|uniref:Cleaved Adhesin Domain n=1 Tax=Myroides guanonis TaxID=1150112 RepID=A0A1I3QJK6_9FLAO|nr:choice-of-anchor J domain-containing protein [Myroides guanonis]SFJ34284.1 Cleaved Adhesin Domain [Myroides guanonis]
MKNYFVLLVLLFMNFSWGKEAADCIAPDKKVIVSNIKPTTASVTWKDDQNSSWEYFVNEAWEGTPVGSGYITGSKSVNIIATNGVGGSNLKPYTEYDFYVRSICLGNKFSDWVGPIRFRTPCDNVSLNFWEGFNKDSKTLACWVILDNNNNATDWNGIWKTQDFSQYEGDRVMSLNGSGPYDDWLISPSLLLDPKKVYRFKYHYSVGAYYINRFEVLLSTTGGVGIPDFNTVLVPDSPYTNTTYLEQKVFLTGITDASIAWHAIDGGGIKIDNVFVEEVINCPEPLHLGAKDFNKNGATLTWTDAFKATGWEYWVQDIGGPIPTGKGESSNKKEVAVTEMYNGVKLLSNKEYEFYVRTDCGNGSYSYWSGPFVFRTLCDTVALPFWEGFNTDSETIECWDFTDPWALLEYMQYEGSHGISLGVYDYENIVNTDSWLLSPTFAFDSKKIYRLKYHFRTNSYNANNNFEVLASNSGSKLNNFTKVIVANKAYKQDSYIEQTSFVTNYGGDVRFAWHTEGVGAKSIYLDNIFVDVVENCPEPQGLQIKDVEKNKATILWTDDFMATKWEYYVQDAGNGKPIGNGTLTSNKEVTIDKKQSGLPLQPNSDYEFYVRTVCSDGTYSVWSGPYVFVTTCDVYTIPFVDGFNRDLKTVRCWEMLNANLDSNSWDVNYSEGFEGDGSLSFSNYAEINNNDLAISPTLIMNGGDYVLKYHYKSSSWTSDAVLDVLYSSEGKSATKFNTVLVPQKTYGNTEWKEQVVFFKTAPAQGNIAWRILSQKTVLFSIDNVIIKEVKSCKEPYYLTLVDRTSSTLDIEWQQDDGIAEWEIIVVKLGEDETATPIQKINVTGKPEATISGLNEGAGYTIYVRAKCSKDSFSEWGTPLKTGTKIGASDECSGAITIPVNKGIDCIVTVPGSNTGATMSSANKPDCFWEAEVDVWYEFTATATDHKFDLENIISLEGKFDKNIYLALYEQDCATISTSFVVPILCESLLNDGKYSRVLFNLTSGKKYYIRLGMSKINVTYDVCLTTSEKGPIEITKSIDQASAEHLVRNVLINSECDLVSNVKYQAGDGTGSIITLGYFNKGESDFPFEEGIVLATHDSDYIAGPYRGFGSFKPRLPFWSGDPDLNDVIDNVGGTGFGSHKAVAVLEFDFVPIRDSIKFEYIFASDSFNTSCAVVCNPGGALFAAWLTEIGTGQGQNIALVPGTQEPIAISSIRDRDKSGASCENINADFYNKHYANNQDNPLLAPINYTGMTIPMSSEKVYVKPGKTYRIKLAIADFCPFLADASAVFINAGSFNIGTIDLGGDLTIENGKALCANESRVIYSGITPNDDLPVEIEWYKDGNIIKGADSPNLEISEDGEYTIKVKYLGLECETIGTVKVEVFPPISSIVKKPNDLSFCRFSLKKQFLDLTIVEQGMFSDSDRNDYNISYFDSELDAKSNTNAIDVIYELLKTNEAISIFMKIENIKTGCHEIFEFQIIPEKGEVPQTPEHVIICASYVFPKPEDNQSYYTESGGKGIEYKTGDVLKEPGEHTIYLLQVNNKEGCYEETSFKVNITKPVIADKFEDEILTCGIHILAPLSNNNKYFTGPGGSGFELLPGTQRFKAETIYVYASSKDGLCVDESSYTIQYEECPIQKGISPNGDGINDAFDLSLHRVESLKIYNRYGTEVYSYGANYMNQWMGQDHSGNPLPDGTYYYLVKTYDKEHSGWVQINR